jgi:hypothetical protein
MIPQWYFMYRGNGYGPLKTLDEAFALYTSKGTPAFPTLNRYDFYRYVAQYGEAHIENFKLIDFDHCPKPFEGRRDPKSYVMVCPFSGYMRLYPFGYST